MIGIVSRSLGIVAVTAWQIPMPPSGFPQWGEFGVGVAAVLVLWRIVERLLDRYAKNGKSGDVTRILSSIDASTQAITAALASVEKQTGKNSITLASMDTRLDEVSRRIA